MLNNKNINDICEIRKENIPILMVGVAIPPELMKDLASRDPSPGMMGFNHQWSVINGIEFATNQIMDLLGVAFISDYPRHPLKFLKGGTWQHKPNAEDKWIPFINVFPFKMLTRFIFNSLNVAKWLWKHRKEKNRIIYIYSTQCSQFYPVLIATLFIKAYKIAIITDPISIGKPDDGFIIRALHWIDRLIQRFAINNLQGIIVLSEQISKTYAPNLPFIVSEGIAPAIESESFENVDASNRFIIVYAGTLKPEYNMTILLDSMKSLPSNVELWIFGTGDSASEVIESAAVDKRIKYFGFVNPFELRKIARQGNVFISHLPTTGWFTRYKFPSKLLEYLAIGLPVISTRYPTIPEEYGQYLIWIDNETAEGIAKTVLNVMQYSKEELRELGKRGREFVLVNKTEEAQGSRIWEFTKEIIEKKSAKR